MQDRTLLKLSLTLTIIGILILTLLPQEKTISINQINNQLLNKNTIILGKIIKIKTINKLTILTIKDKTGIITATTFEPLNTTLNKKLKIKGKITEYNDKLQLQIDKITTI